MPTTSLEYDFSCYLPQFLRRLFIKSGFQQFRGHQPASNKRRHKLHITYTRLSYCQQITTLVLRCRPYPTLLRIPKDRHEGNLHLC